MHTAHSTVFRAFKIMVTAAAVVALMAMLVVAVTFFAFLLGFFDTPFKNRIVSDPAKDFEDHTGLKFPKGAIVALAEDSHWDGESGGFGIGPGLLDGHLWIVFDTDPEVIKIWMADNRGVHGKLWKKGPIPESVPFLSFPSTEGGIKKPSNMYSGDVAGNDGTLLVVDPKTGRVWLSQWNR